MRIHPQCREQGHDWREAKAAHLLICMCCGMERSALASNFPGVEEDEDTATICIWCGQPQGSVEALEAHEEECEP